MNRHEIDALVRESGLDPAAYTSVSDALATLTAPTEAPTPNPQLAAALRAGGHAPASSRRALVLAGGTLAVVLGIGGAAAANKLPDPMQDFLHDVTVGGLPFEFPAPEPSVPQPQAPADRALILPANGADGQGPWTPPDTAPPTRGEPGTTGPTNTPSKTPNSTPSPDVTPGAPPEATPQPGPSGPGFAGPTGPQTSDGDRMPQQSKDKAPVDGAAAPPRERSEPPADESLLDLVLDPVLQILQGGVTPGPLLSIR